MGGHGSFWHAVLYTDYFAAAVPLAGSFITQVGYSAVDLMLVNVRHLPMLVVWGELDRVDSTGRLDERSGISGANRDVRRVAKRLGIPLEMVELSGVGHGGVRPPADRFHEMLRRVRPRALKEFEHWFRYPPQGRYGWLRQVEYQGIPWNGKQLRVRPRGVEDYDEAALRVLKRKLAFIGGRIEGQTIHVETRKCKRFDVLLSDDLIDLDQPITIVHRGKQVFSGRVAGRVDMLLDVARGDWDFDRLFPVRFRVSRDGTAEQY